MTLIDPEKVTPSALQFSTAKEAESCNTSRNNGWRINV